MNPYPRYTPDELLFIRKNAGVISDKEIAKAIGKEQKGVQIQARKMGVSLRLLGELHHGSKLSDLQVEMINALTVSGFRPCEIHKAAFSHVHRNTVHAVVAAYNRKVK